MKENYYSFKNLQMTTRAVNILQKFEQFLNVHGATLEGDVSIKVSEMGDVIADVKMFLPVVLLEECDVQSSETTLDVA